MIDAGLGYGRDVQTAMRVAREMQDLGICWLEEPFEPDELQAYAELTAAVDLPIAAGEHETTRWGFLELIERGGLDIVQPDVTRVWWPPRGHPDRRTCTLARACLCPPRVEERHREGRLAPRIRRSG